MKCVWGNGKGNVLFHAGLSRGWHLRELGLLISELISLSLLPQLPLCFTEHSSLGFTEPTITITTIITTVIIIIIVMPFLKPFVQLKRSLFFCLSKFNSSLPALSSFLQSAQQCSKIPASQWTPQGPSGPLTAHLLHPASWKLFTQFLLFWCFTVPLHPMLARKG